jgi:hypothetical protein
MPSTPSLLVAPERKLIHDAELPQGRRDCGAVDGNLLQHATPSKAVKMPGCPALTKNCSRAKRARLTQTETQRRTCPILPKVEVKKLKHYAEPPRRSARLQEQHPPDSAKLIRPSGALFRRQNKAGSGISTSERLGLTRRNTQLEAEVGQTTVSKV